MSSYQPTGIKNFFHTARRVIAKNWLSLFRPTQIAITGSQGKTVTTQIAAAVASALGPTVVTDINLDTLYNVPITALQVRPWTKYIVWELGIDQKGEMDKHLEIARPTISFITGISPVHTDEEHLGSLENLIAEKQKIISVLPTNGFAILNFDSPEIRQMSRNTQAKILSYGTTADCTAWYNHAEAKITTSGTTFLIHYNNISFPLKTNLIGDFHGLNLLAGYLLFVILNKKTADHLDYQKIINPLKPLRGRMNLEPGPLKTLLLNDSLRANPESTRAGLATLEKITYSKGRKIAVIGEMGELADPPTEHKKTGEILANYHFDYVVCIGPLRKYTIEQAVDSGFPPQKITYAPDVFAAAEILKNYLCPNDLWYLKGSLLRNYKRIIQLLRGEKVCCREIICPYSHCGYNN